MPLLRSFSRTSVSARQTTRSSDAVVTVGDYATGLDAEIKNDARLAVTQKLANRVLRIRMFGSVAVDLVWLAEGRIDASVTLSNRSWDVAAGVIIAREAGAQVIDLDGADHTIRSGSTIAAAPGLRRELTNLLAAPT